MNRGFIIASVLIAAGAAAAFSIRACAATKEAPARVAATPAAAPAAAATASQWQPGLNYDVLGYPQPTEVTKGKVEVNEVFWYGCSHCYALDPVLEDWKKHKPDYIEFVRIPVIWGDAQRQHARLFYTLKKLGRLDELHAKVFDAIHQGGKPLAGGSDAEARAQQLAFLKENGVSESEFNAAYDSPEVEANVDAAQKATSRYEVASVPTLIIAGQYATSVSQAGGNAQLLALITDLAERELHR
jgi:protein dithiol oxidoreductase (disulfide-forming)